MYIANVKVTQTEIVVDDDGAKAPLENGNHVYNGSFTLGNDRLAYWHVEGAQDSKVSGDKKLVLVPQDGSAVVYQQGIQLLQNDIYELSFTASGESGKIVSVKLADGVNVYAQKELVLTGTAITDSLTFTVPEGVSTDSAVLTFTVNGTTTLDDIVLLRETNRNVDYTNIKVYPMTNGDFSQGMAGWSTYGTDMGVVQEDGNQIGYAVAGPGGNPWDRMLIYEGLSLVQGQTYEVSFRAKAEAEAQTVEAKIENASYTATFDQQFTVGTEWQTYTFTFKSSLQGKADFKYLLALTDTNGKIYFDDVVIKVTGAEVEEAPRLTSNGPVREGKRAVFTYEENAAWEAAELTVYVDGVEVPASRVILDTENNTISLKAKAFSGTGTHRVKFVAAGFDYIEAEQTILALDGNVLANGDFTNGADNWSFWAIEDAPGNACAELEVIDGRAHVAFKWAGHSEWGPFTWTIQLSNTNVAVEKGKEYILTFDASSTLDRSIEVWGKGAAETLLGSVELSGETGQYTLRFTADTDLYEYIQFRLGTTQETMDAHDIYIDNMKLVAADQVDVDVTPDDPDDVDPVEPEKPEDKEDSGNGGQGNDQGGSQGTSSNGSQNVQGGNTSQGAQNQQKAQEQQDTQAVQMQENAYREKTDNRQQGTQQEPEIEEGNGTDGAVTEENEEAGGLDEKDAAETEDIAEEDTPLASGNVKESPARNTFIWVLLGIAAVSAVIVIIAGFRKKKEE